MSQAKTDKNAAKPAPKTPDPAPPATPALAPVSPTAGARAVASLRKKKW